MDQELRDIVIKTHTVVEGMSDRLEKMDDHFEKIDEKFEKHNDSINSLKTFRAWILGLFSTGTIGGGSFAAFKHFLGCPGPGG